VAAQRLAEAQDELAALGNDVTMSRVHQTAASRLLRLCHVNRGVYIKVGQHLANLDYLLPSEYITTLSALYDDTPVTDFATVCRVVEQELGAHPLDLFDSFDPIPIASASLAQVHVAYRRGVKLAVKVQHDGLRETSVGDVANLTWAVRCAERLVPDFSLGWLADEIAPNLFKELDFAHEGRNADQAREHLATTGLSCVIPQIHWNLTSARVLTMEFEEGFKATDVESIERAGLSRYDVSTLIASVFASQVFGSGHVHCDPHEANVLVRAQDGKPVLVLVDHGLYQTLDKNFSQQYALLWKSLMLADLKGIEKQVGDWVWSSPTRIGSLQACCWLAPLTKLSSARGRVPCNGGAARRTTTGPTKPLFEAMHSDIFPISWLSWRSYRAKCSSC
jgi:aarF domain-containing kinase